MEYVSNLRQFRKLAGLTQQQVTEVLQIPRTQLVRYEQGKNELPIRYLIELCKLYHVTPNELLGFENEYSTEERSG